jgi:SAM-dependent methyltransferase
VCAVLGDAALQSEALEDLASAVNYRRWLASLALPYIGEHPIDIGSGNGDYVVEWLTRAERVTATEAEPARLEELRARFARDERVDVVEYFAPSELERDHSAAVAFNVLEHIRDDVAALRSFGRLVRRGGAVVLIVPAFEFATSRFDRALGHQRRYRVETLRAALDAASLRTERIHYVNSLGLLAWFTGMRLLGMTPREGPILSFWDKAVVPALRTLEGKRPPPFGQSVFAVARG